MKIKKKIKKVLQEEKKEKYLNTDMYQKVQIEKVKRKRKLKTINPTVKRGTQGEIQRKMTNIIKAKQREGPSLKAEVKVKRSQKVKKEIPGITGMKRRG